MVLALGIKDPFDVTVQRPHDTDPGQHRGAAGLCNEDERLYGGLPFGRGALRRLVRRAAHCLGAARRLQGESARGCAVLPRPFVQPL
jgi:hypothetical protein